MSTKTILLPKRMSQSGSQTENHWHSRWKCYRYATTTKTVLLQWQI